jgi:hypothetical protein
VSLSSLEVIGDRVYLDHGYVKGINPKHRAVWDSAVLRFRQQYLHPSGVGLFTGGPTFRTYCEEGQDYTDALAEALMLRDYQEIRIHIAEKQP